MKLRDYYDWIVLGDDPGALLSASLVARLGLSVLILPFSEERRLWISDFDDYLDLESNYLLGLGALKSEPALLAACLQRLGMTAQEKSLIQVDPSGPQVLTRSSRISLNSNFERLSAHFRREFGAEGSAGLGLAVAVHKCAAAVENFWISLPLRLTLKTKGNGESQPSERSEKDSPATLEKLAGQLGHHFPKSETGARQWTSTGQEVQRWADKTGFPDALALCEGIVTCLTASAVPADLKMFDVLHLLCLSGSGGSFQGGMTAYRDFLLRLARRNGADLPQKTTCRRVFVQNGKLSGVLPSSHGSMIGVGGGILGCALEQARPYITVANRAWLRDMKKSLKAVGWKFSLALTVHSEAISPAMSTRMVWQEPGAPFLEIEISRPRDYGLKDLGRTVIFLRTLMPMTEQSLTAEYQRLISARMLRKLTEICPFLEFHIARIYPEFRQETAPELENIYGFGSLSSIPAHLLCYSGQGLGAQSGVEGLFVSSGESFPQYGSLGGTMAALEAVAWIAHRSGFSGPFK